MSVPDAPLPGIGRHDRAAAALIASYLRGLSKRDASSGSSPTAPPREPSVVAAELLSQRVLEPPLDPHRL
jgi:hypothetical protein